jgi:hypothetical protein
VTENNADDLTASYTLHDFRFEVQYCLYNRYSSDPLFYATSSKCSCIDTYVQS